MKPFYRPATFIPTAPCVGFLALFLFTGAQTGCTHRIYNQEAHENAYISFLNIPRVKGILTNRTEIKTNDLELRAFWDCDYVKNAVIFKAPGDCGSQDQDIPLGADGSFTTPAYLNFKTSLNPTSTDAIQTVRFVVGLKNDSKLSARKAITSTFATGEKICFRTDASEIGQRTVNGDVRRVVDTKATPQIMNKLTVYKLRPQPVHVTFQTQKALEDFFKARENHQLKFYVQFLESEMPFGAMTQFLNYAERINFQNATLGTKNSETIELPSQFLLVPGILPANPTVRWKLTLAPFAAASGEGALNDLKLALVIP